MSNQTFRVKSGNTRREIRIIVEQDGQAFDLVDVTAATLVVSAAARYEFPMSDGDETGELFYALSDADYTNKIPPRFYASGKPIPYACELWLAFSDGTTAPVPETGVNWIVVENRL